MTEQTTSAHIARSAGIVALGQILTRALGMAREMAIAAVFGATGMVDAYRAARRVPITLYDLLVGGLVSSALVPTFSEYVARGRRDELWRLASLLFTLLALVLGVTILVVELAAPLVTELLVQFNVQDMQAATADLQAATTDLLRIAIVSVFFVGLSGLATGLCHALQRFTLPALAAAAFNGSIVALTLLWGTRWPDVRVLAVGLICGAALQFLIQLPALRGMRFVPTLNLRHPALRPLLTLYWPVILSLVVSSVGVFIDKNLASRIGESRISWMEYATTLRELPHGLVSLAISAAILPTLSAQAAFEQRPDGDDDRRRGEFCATLGRGLGLVLALILPAAVGMFVLAHPLVALMFQRGQFDAASTAQTALALRYYLAGMVFAAVDLPLVFAFYARRDTLRPALVGIVGVLVYLAVALPTYRRLDMVGLILANDAQLGAHMLAMLWLFRRRVGPLTQSGVLDTLYKSLLASAVMGGVVYGITRFLPGSGLWGWVVTIAAGGAAGLGVYWAVCTLLRVRELALLGALVRRVGLKLRSKQAP